MKQDKLYTVNRWNRPAFAPEENIYAFGDGMGLNTGNFNVGMSYKPYGDAPYVNWSNGADRAKAAGYINSLTSGYTGNSGSSNTGDNQALISGLANGLGDVASNAISGKYQSSNGKTFGTVLSTVGSGLMFVNPAIGAAVVGLGKLGEGIINRVEGKNQEKIANEKEEKERKQLAYNTAMADIDMAQNYNNYTNENAWVNSLNYQPYNSAAYGGLFEQMTNDNDMNAINYGFISDYLLNRKKQTEAKQNNTETVFKNGGKIHIKPENRGKLTALKKRTGKTEAELYKNGGKAVRKMITFARNARKWKHADGGYLLEPFFNSSTWANPIPDVTTPMELPKGGTYGGGHFGGSGASSPFDYPDTQFEEVRDTIWVPVTQDFNTAFRNARKAGLDEFTFDGKKYSTEIGDNPNNYKAGKKRTESFLVPIERKKKQVKKHDLGGPLVWNGDNMFALGGDYQTNGADFTTGLRHIDAGGSHEMNPYDGVQQGVDGEGVPNLVEEGEVVFNDYVYSNRIELDEQAKVRFHFPKKKDITYADAAKKLEKEAKERPNDPISKAALKAQLSDLADEQERQKKEMEAENARRAFEALPPEEQTAIMEQVAQAEQAQAVQAIATQQQEQQSMQEPSLEQAAMMQQQMMADGSEAAIGMQPQMACGGKLYAPGGYLWEPFWNIVNEYSKQKGSTSSKYKIDPTYKNVKELEQSNEYKAFTDYILNKASDEERKKYFQWIDANTGRTNKYIDADGNLVNGWQQMFTNARNDGLYGIQHYTPNLDTTEAPATVSANSTQVYIDNGNGVIPVDISALDDTYTIEDFDGVKIARKKAAPVDNNTSVDTNTAEDNTEVKPAYKNETNYSLYTPLIDAALMAAGVGKPDFTELDNIMNRVDSHAYLADWKPIGTYVPYKPFDVWSQRNRNAANLASTIRAINNTVNPNKQASTIAALNTALNADGQLGIQAEQTNYNNLLQSAGFNKDTEKYNSTAFGQNSQFNTNALNQYNQFRGNLATNIALNKLQNKADYEGNWYQIASNFSDRLAQWEKWKRDYNTATDTLFSRGVGMSEETPVTRGRIKKIPVTKGTSNANGGKVKRRKKGLTI